MRRAPFLAAFIIALCAVFAGSAYAASVYSVGGVRVDVTAASPSEARADGFAQAQNLAFSRLVKRLTRPDELAAKGAPALSGSALDTLVANVDIEQERPSGAHYVAQLRVNFDPVTTRAALQARGLSVVETGTAPILVVAQLPANTPALADQWRAAWTAYGDELVPVSVAPNTLTGAPDWTKAATFAASAGATSALYANARLAGGAAYADLVVVSATGLPRVLGTVSAPLSPGAESAAFAALADAANDRIQAEWKRGLTSGAGQRERIVASAVYGSQAEWRRLQHGLEGAAKTVVSGVSIDAVSRSAAMVSFAYVGGRDQLAAELLRNGVKLEDSPQGPILKLAPGGA